MWSCSNFCLNGQDCLRILPRVAPKTALAITLLGIILIITGLIYFGCFTVGIFPVCASLLLVGWITCVWGICLLLKSMITAPSIRTENLIMVLHRSALVIDSLQNRIGDFLKKYNLQAIVMEDLSQRINSYDRELSRLENELSFEKMTEDQRTAWKEDITALSTTIEKFINSTDSSLGVAEGILDDFGGSRGLKILIDSASSRCVLSRNQLGYRMVSEFFLQSFFELSNILTLDITAKMNFIKDLQRDTCESPIIMIPTAFLECPGKDEDFILDSMKEEVIARFISELECKIVVLDEERRFLQCLCNKWRSDGREVAFQYLKAQEFETMEMVECLDQAYGEVWQLESWTDAKRVLDGLEFLHTVQESTLFSELGGWMDACKEKVKKLEDIGGQFIQSMNIRLWEANLKRTTSVGLDQILAHVRSFEGSPKDMTNIPIQERAFNIVKSRKGALLRAQNKRSFLQRTAPWVDVVEDDELKSSSLEFLSREEIREERLIAGIRNINNQIDEMTLKINDLKQTFNQEVAKRGSLIDAVTILKQYSNLYQKMSFLLQQRKRLNEEGSIDGPEYTLVEESLEVTKNSMMIMGTPYSDLAISMLSEQYWDSWDSRQHQRYFNHVFCILSSLELKATVRSFQNIFMSQEQDKKLLISAHERIRDARSLFNAVLKLQSHFLELGCLEFPPFNNRDFIRKLSVLGKLIESMEVRMQTTSTGITGTEALVSMLKEIDLNC